MKARGCSCAETSKLDRRINVRVLDPVHTNTGIFKTDAFSMQFGRL